MTVRRQHRSGAASSRDLPSVPADGRPADGVAAIAIRLDARPAAPAQRHRCPVPGYRIAVLVDDLGVAADDQRTVGRHGDADRCSAHRTWQPGIGSFHCSMVTAVRRQGELRPSMTRSLRAPASETSPRT